MPGRLQQAATRAANVRKRRLAQLAGMVADGAQVTAAGRAMGLTKGQTARAWADIKQALGRQAI